MIHEYLKYFLKYTDEELKMIEITDTKVTANKDNMVYFSLNNTEDIREIYKRKSEVRNEEIHIHNYIPPPFHARYMHLSSVCSDKRASNPNLKTQMRFSNSDIIVLCKTKGSKDPFTIVQLEVFTDISKVPCFDDTTDPVPSKSKTKVLKVTGKEFKPVSMLPVTLNGVNLPFVPSLTHLGVTLNSTGNMERDARNKRIRYIAKSK